MELPVTRPRIRDGVIVFCILATFLPLSSALPLHSVTLVSCGVANLKTIALFFLANYVAHAATALPPAGGTFVVSAVMSLISLVYPFIGLARSIVLALTYLSAKDDVGKAITQGSVVVAARSPDWIPSESHDELVYVRFGKGSGFPENTDRYEDLAIFSKALWPEPTFCSSVERRRAKFHWVDGRSLKLNQSLFDIHGETLLPPGYHWTIPGGTILEDLASQTIDREHIRVGRSLSVLKALASVAQVIFSSVTIYQARGTQLEKYGYAAFGLSVFPYTLMSLVNLVASAITGEYPTIYILRTAVLEEAKQRGGKISGDMGTLSATRPTGMESQDDVAMPSSEEAGLDRNSTEYPPQRKRFIATRLQTRRDQHKVILVARIDSDLNREFEFELINRYEEDDSALVIHISATRNVEGPVHIGDRMGFIHGFPIPVPLGGLPFSFGYSVYVAVLIIPHVFIFLLTNFHKGHSTKAERRWMMSWLVFNQLLSVCGVFLAPFHAIFSMLGAAGPGELITFLMFLCACIGALIYAIPAFGGFVVVGKMLLEYTPCSISTV